MFSVEILISRKEFIYFMQLIIYQDFSLAQFWSISLFLCLTTRLIFAFDLLECIEIYSVMDKKKKIHIKISKFVYPKILIEEYTIFGQYYNCKVNADEFCC